MTGEKGCHSVGLLCYRASKPGTGCERIRWTWLRPSAGLQPFTLNNNNHKQLLPFLRADPMQSMGVYPTFGAATSASVCCGALVCASRFTSHGSSRCTALDTPKRNILPTHATSSYVPKLVKPFKCCICFGWIIYFSSKICVMAKTYTRYVQFIPRLVTNSPLPSHPPPVRCGTLDDAGTKRPQLHG